MLNHVDVVSEDVEAAIAFYRRLGVEIPEDAVWRHNGRAHHVCITLSNGVELSLSSAELTKNYAKNADCRAILITSVPSRDAVDALFADLTGAGHPVVEEPFDAFWGARYAIVRDPAGNNIGIMSPSDQDHKSVPGFVD